MTNFYNRLKTIYARQNRVSEIRWDIFDNWFGFFRATPYGQRKLAQALNILNQLELDRKVLMGRTHRWHIGDRIPPWYCRDCSTSFESYPILSNILCPAFINTLNVAPNYDGKSYRPKIYKRKT